MNQEAMGQPMAHCPMIGYVFPHMQPQAVIHLPTLLTQRGHQHQQQPACAAVVLAHGLALESCHPQQGARAAECARAAEGDGVIGRVWNLSRDSEGCWKVQRALETAGSDEACAAIASELSGHVWEAVRDPHANHVIQKCIIMLRPRAVQFIVDEIMRGPIVFQAVRHKYGCRIVQRLLEQCLPDQIHGLAEAILSDIYWLSRHPYGNYVMQHLLEFGSASQQERIVEAVAANLRGLARDTHGRSVVNACLFHGPQESKATLARAIAEEPGLLDFMSRTRHGRLAVRIVQDLLQGPKAGLDGSQQHHRRQRRARTSPQ